MTTRPSMHARDSSGRQVSLLNDEPSQHRHSSSSIFSSRSISDLSPSSCSGSPPTPALMRADSFDSQHTNDAASPITPHSELRRQNSFPNGAPSHTAHSHFDYRERTPSYDDFAVPQYGMRSTPAYGEAYDDEAYHHGSLLERGGKRFSCRYRDTLGCEKTFTTSGHASRHSKIHTAEKAVPCTFQGCQKKFTRNDNMKQHLETHYRDRSRSSALSKSGANPPVLTLRAGIRKSGRAASRPTTPPTRNASTAGMPPIIDPALYSPIDWHRPAVQRTFQPPDSPHAFEQSLSPTSNGGLDALAMASTITINRALRDSASNVTSQGP
ncbi:putative transcriptional regulator NRG1 [Amylocarpus encephaloides]|uniref:C2H2 type master regulator of conidiophore development brlA n=1 Tax=Amylocarpus encephaloides TaxID=45428 RepID=A0A9P8C311_9HELO|nr:putative transcriptional regulator NRG1 [Amylocarpus encephaloides]